MCSLGEIKKVDKEMLLAYKEWLIQHYAISSVNSMLVALNQFLTFREMGRLRLKQVKVQRSDIMGQEKALEKRNFKPWYLWQGGREKNRSP